MCTANLEDQIEAEYPNLYGMISLGAAESDMQVPCHTNADSLSMFCWLCYMLEQGWDYSTGQARKITPKDF
jgi:hypothetical protein